MTNKFLTQYHIRDSKGKFTGHYSLGFNWSALVPYSGFRIPAVWAGLQLIVLALVFYSLY